MMDVAKILIEAREHGYAIGAFNTNNLEVTKAICQAAKASGKLVLVQTTPSAIEYAGLKTIFDIIRDEIENSGIKAAIHLDHGKDWETAKACIDIGYKSVMIDGSKLPFQQNVDLTKKVVDYAHETGVCVEGEIGVLGALEVGETGSNTNDILSTPSQVAEFVKATRIDSVAVAIGNEHGAPAHEKIDLELLAKISQIISIPLVLHGSSGLPDDQIKSAISLGVAKINVDTLIRKDMIGAILDAKDSETDYRNIFKDGMSRIAAVVKDRIELFS